jgi:hypothetical protein
MQFTDLAVGKANMNRLLLLPQSKYRDIIKRARQGRPFAVDLQSDQQQAHDYDDADDDDDEDNDDYMSDFITKHAAAGGDVSRAQIQHLSKIEQVVLRVHIAIKVICEYLGIVDISHLYVACTNIRNVYDQSVVETKLRMIDFCKFVNSKFRLRTAGRRAIRSCGLLSNKQLTCSQSGTKLLEEDSVHFAQYFESGALQEFSISLKSLFITLDADISLTSIGRLFTSMGGIGDSLRHLSLEGEHSLRLTVSSTHAIAFLTGSAIGFDGISALCDLLNKDALPNIRCLNINSKQSCWLVALHYCPKNG